MNRAEAGIELKSSPQNALYRYPQQECVRVSAVLIGAYRTSGCRRWVVASEAARCCGVIIGITVQPSHTLVTEHGWWYAIEGGCIDNVPVGGHLDGQKRSASR